MVEEDRADKIGARFEPAAGFVGLIKCEAEAAFVYHGAIRELLIDAGNVFGADAFMHIYVYEYT